MSMCILRVCVTFNIYRTSKVFSWSVAEMQSLPYWPSFVSAIFNAFSNHLFSYYFYTPLFQMKVNNSHSYSWKQQSIYDILYLSYCKCCLHLYKVLYLRISFVGCISIISEQFTFDFFYY